MLTAPSGDAAALVASAGAAILTGTSTALVIRTPPMRRTASAAAGTLRGRLRGLAPFAAGTVGFVTFGPPWGIAVAVLAGVWMHRSLSARARATARTATGQREDEPVIALLLAAALTAGVPPRVAARSVGRALGGGVGERLRRRAAVATLGAPAQDAWTPAMGEESAFERRLGGVLSATEQGGLAPVEALHALGAQAAAEIAAERSEVARTIGVRSVAPLGLCFLPAFVLVGVVPAAAGALHLLDL